jgi:predicted dehydrogenase
MYNLAIIGCGRISYKHVQAVAENSEQVKLIACCDIIEANAQKRAEEYIQAMLRQIEELSLPSVYKEYKEMLAKEKIDLVAICTESGYHTEIAIECMNHGKHVIVEKPMALSTLDADEMIQIAQRNNVKLCVSHQNRFNAPIKKLYKAIQEGRFGRIIAGNARILWNRDEGYYKQAPWRGTYELDGGCLMNQCIHNIDLLQWLLGGDIKWVHGEVYNYEHPYIEAEDYGTIQIKFGNGAIGNVEGTVCVIRKI